MRFIRLVQQDITPTLVVGEVPAAPAPSIAQKHSASSRVERASAVSTPYGLDTDLCASISDRTNPSSCRWLHIFGSQPKCGHQQFRRVFPERWMLPSRVRGEQPMRSHRCGAKIDVFATPNFSLSLDPFCEGDPDAEVLGLYSDYN